MNQRRDAGRFEFTREFSFIVRRFAVERFVLSKRTQKMFDRAFKELSIDVYVYEIQSKLSQ